MSLCLAHLMEKDWREGFICSLPADHDGPHRAEGKGIGEDNESTDQDGRAYTWVQEWRWT